MKIAILILAAGRSNRMKSSKQLLAVGKTTLLGITLKNALLSSANNIYVILGANVEAIKISISKYNVETIFNPNYETGLSSSIVAGVKHLQKENFDAILILLGDQPLITSTYINEMITTFKMNKENVIVSKYYDTFGVPAVIPKSHFNQLLKLKGDKGAKDWLNTNREDIICMQNTNLTDIDTQKEYQDYLNSINYE